jgi:translation elongation factor EF-1alpha
VNKVKEKKVGKVTHYYSNLSVAAVELMGGMAVGDTIVIRGATTELEQEVDSMQIERQHIKKAGAGQIIGVRVREKVRDGDLVYKK